MAEEHPAARLYAAQHATMVELAAGIVRDSAAAGRVVEDAFEGVTAAWPQLADEGERVAYLRQCVVNRARSMLRHDIR